MLGFCGEMGLADKAIEKTLTEQEGRPAGAVGLVDVVRFVYRYIVGG